MSNRNKDSYIGSLTIKDYQISMVDKLAEVFIGIPVQREWSAMTDARDLYCPRLDVVVGPFAIRKSRLESEYDQMMDDNRGLIDRLINLHNNNIQSLSWEIPATSWDKLKWTNRNARCFLAIEIENEVSRKHLIGGAVNAAALGRIGIVVAWNRDKLKAFVKLRRYLNFLASVGKNSFNTQNLLILDPKQLTESLQTV